MKITSLFWTLLCISTIVNSQVNSGKVTYQVDMERFSEKIGTADGASSQQAKLAKEVAKAADHIETELLFKGKKSVFRTRKGLSINDSPALKFVKSMVAKGEYFTDINTNSQLLKTSPGGEDLWVAIEKSNLNWTLTKETKKIGKFSCYKATAVKKVPAGERTLVAWYAPSIPLSFGPTEYGGVLPGLILELDDLLVSYRCSSITLNPEKELKMEWPEDINAMTTEEYQKKGEEFYKKIRSRGGK